MNEARRQEYLRRIRQLRLLDDDFMSKCFEDLTCTQFVLRILLEKEDLIVQRVETQYPLKNLQGRSIRLDVYAVDAFGRQYNVEIQRDDRGAGAKRARLNSSLMDSNVLAAGESTDCMPESYVIFITEHDVLKRNRPLYHIDRFIAETGEKFEDGSHILYVNAEVRDDTPVGRLMADFACAEPNQMYYRPLAERTRYFKENEEGVGSMCRIFEEMREEIREETRVEERNLYAQRMLKNGKFSLEEIAELAGLPLAEVKRLTEKNTVKQ